MIITVAGRYYGSSEKFLGQKIQSESVTKINWFCLQGENVVYSQWERDPIYIPPYKRNKMPIVEQAIFSSKTAEGDFVLFVQKDYPKNDKRTNFGVTVYKGTFEQVFPKQYGDALEPNRNLQIIGLTYGTNKDYNFIETGSETNQGKLREIRYIYGRNMFALTDNRRDTDNRLVYGVHHDEYGAITYSGIISEAGYNSFERLQPIGMIHVPLPFEEFERRKEELISKIYFQGHDRIRGNKTLGIVKTRQGVKIVRDQVKYDGSGEFRKRMGYERIEEIDIPSETEEEITVEEIQNAIGILRQNNPDDNLVEAICSELEIFIEQKMTREKSSEMECQVSDLCNPNSMIHFDMEFIVDMITKQGARSAILNIIKGYSEMFRNNQTAVINCNREAKHKEL